MKKISQFLLPCLFSSALFAQNMALEVHPSGKVGVNLPEGSEPDAQLEINGNAKINGIFNLEQQTELPASGEHGDVVLLDDDFLYIYLAGEWRKILLSVPQSNEKPNADAGTNQIAVDSDEDGSENITLDASASTDDGTISSYLWEVDGEEIANTANPTVSLPNGFHVVSLTVKDNYDVASTDEVLVNVRPAAEDFDSSSNFSSLPLIAPPALPTGSNGSGIGELTFNASTTAKTTKTYNSVTLNRSVEGISQFDVSFKLGLSAPEVGDLRVRVRVFFDTGTVNTSYYQLDGNDHEEMETFKVTKAVPSGATKITKLAIQARINSTDTVGQTGYIEDLVVEEHNLLNQF